MSKLDKTFPTVDCSSCILGPRMVDISQHPLITLYTLSEVEEVGGFVGNFTVKVRRKAAYVDWEACTGCGLCMEKCPSKRVSDRFNEGIGKTTAINIPFPRHSKKASIDAQGCLMLTKGKCGVCAKVCPAKAIDFPQQDSFVEEKVGAIIAATGYDLFDFAKYGEYGGGRYPDVITSLQYERLLSASGPTGGHIKRPSDGKEPRDIVFIQCVGSRDKSIGRPYCSGFCCMYTAKQTILTKDHLPDSQSYVFYMDIRAPENSTTSSPAGPWRCTAPVTSGPRLGHPAQKRPLPDQGGGHPAWRAGADRGRHGGLGRGGRSRRRSPSPGQKSCAFPTTPTAFSSKAIPNSRRWRPTPPASIWPGPARGQRTFPLPWPRAARPPARS